MSKKPKKGTKQGLARQDTANPPSPTDFDEVLRLIDAARTRAVAAVNTTLIELYWSIGEYISRKIESAAWGEGVVEQLAAHIARTHPSQRGFTRRNLFRMRQFYETYRGDEKVSPLVTQLPWTHNLLILSHSKRPEEREFYLRMALQERWSKRQLERQFAGALFERVVMSPGESRSTAATITSRRCHRLQGQLPRRVPRPSAGAFRGRPATRSGRAAQEVPDRTRPRLLLRRQSLPGSGWRTRL